MPQSSNSNTIRAWYLWDKSEAVPIGAQVIAAVSLILWMIVIACGRLMAYEL